MDLVSFDIDGTLESGDPPGPLSLDLVRAVQQHGHLIGSASDRTRREQQDMWDRSGISVDFLGHKHHLGDLRERFPAARYLHIGDTHVDEHYAGQAGFEFLLVTEAPDDVGLDWILGQ